MDREFLRLVLPYIGDFEQQLEVAVRGDPDEVAQFAHSKMLLQEALLDKASFGYFQVRPDNCYIICVLGYLHI